MPYRETRGKKGEQKTEGIKGKKNSGLHSGGPPFKAVEGGGRRRVNQGDIGG